TWVEKAADLYGLGTNAIRWIRVEENGQLDTRMLEERIIQDQKEGYYPFLVVGTAGSVSIGVVDPLDKISSICKKHNMWFHIDGAYGILAAGLPEESKQFKGMKQADSIALDPHKWLYSPLEAGCVLVKDKKLLRDTFSFSPDYYHFAEEKEEPETNFYEYGPQNSRGFKALKVWLALKQAGRSGYVQMLRDDILLSKKLRDMLQNHENFEVMTNHLSITTFRYLPLKTSAQQSFGDDYLNLLNKNLVTALQEGGKVYCSNAIINDQYCLRVCIVNFRTRENDLSVLVTAALEEGKKIHDDLFERYPR
ncbi:MAG: aminotransferase class V-fold PLP-dependent enzyme, partial [Cyclobacteriaceae bacterium]|nr:aminotransferase class V-fold PLP-dependent enzyme [Cyclobacteriaceae bacterium]